MAGNICQALPTQSGAVQRHAQRPLGSPRSGRPAHSFRARNSHLVHHGQLIARQDLAVGQGLHSSTFWLKVSTFAECSQCQKRLRLS